MLFPSYTEWHPKLWGYVVLVFFPRGSYKNCSTPYGLLFQEAHCTPHLYNWQAELANPKWYYRSHQMGSWWRKDEFLLCPTLGTAMSAGILNYLVSTSSRPHGHISHTIPFRKFSNTFALRFDRYRGNQPSPETPEFESILPLARKKDLWQLHAGGQD